MPTSYCAPYGGSVCKKYIAPTAFVYYNLTTVSSLTGGGCSCVHDDDDDDGGIIVRVPSSSSLLLSLCSLERLLCLP